MSTKASIQTVDLVAHLDEAVRAQSVDTIVQRVKTVLEQVCQHGGIRLPEEFRRPLAERYARRLLHRDSDLGYTAVVMTWGPGQRTGLHDHAGIWCVEVVVQGQMEITQYDLANDAVIDGAHQFEQQDTVHATVGSAGSLIPPFEYHVLANALPDETSITLHIYGGEMDRCNLYEPRPDGRYDRQERALGYDN